MATTIGIGLLLIPSLLLAVCQREQTADVRVPSPTHQAATASVVRSTATLQHLPSEVSSPSPSVRASQIVPTTSIPLDNPRAIAIAAGGDIYVADSGDPSQPFPGRVLRISSTGDVETTLAPFSAFSASTAGETYAFGLSSVATSPDMLYVLLGVGAFLQNPIYAENQLIAVAPNGEITQLFSLAGYEAGHDPDGLGIDSNAMDVAYAEDGSLWITDAAGNWAAHLVPTDTEGKPLEVATVAVFPAVDGEDAVPTGIAVGPDGSAYVALFRCRQPTAGKGGIARVYPDGSFEIVVDSLSNPIDVGFDAFGNMYVLEFATDYAPETGRLLAVHKDGTLVTVLEDLTFPTSFAINDRGDVYVTEIATPAGGATGSGKLLVYASLVP